MSDGYTYSVGDAGPDDRYPVPEWTGTDDPEEMAEHCARDFYYDRDGYRGEDWPWHLSVYGPDGADVGRFEIYIEMEPVFTVEDDCG